MPKTFKHDHAHGLFGLDLNKSSHHHPLTSSSPSQASARLREKLMVRYFYGRLKQLMKWIRLFK